MSQIQGYEEDDLICRGDAALLCRKLLQLTSLLHRAKGNGIPPQPVSFIFPGCSSAEVALTSTT